MKAARNIIGGADNVRELFRFLWARRLWWMIPFVATLPVVAVLLLVGQATGIAPFIYTLFWFGGGAEPARLPALKGRTGNERLQEFGVEGQQVTPAVEAGLSNHVLEHRGNCRPVGDGRKGTGSVKTPMSRNRKPTAEGRKRALRHLRELIAAIDRRVPQIERDGEIAIARDAAALRLKAEQRISELERED
jgi:hypothetical protein